MGVDVYLDAGNAGNDGLQRDLELAGLGQNWREIEGPNYHALRALTCLYPYINLGWDDSTVVPDMLKCVKHYIRTGKVSTLDSCPLYLDILWETEQVSDDASVFLSFDTEKRDILAGKLEKWLEIGLAHNASLSVG